jgi:hypothetical protein
METTLIRTLVTLGVPGAALGVFYLLLRVFNFQFSQINPEWTALIAVLFLLIVGGVTFYALRLWAPAKQSQSPVRQAEPHNRGDFPTIVLTFGGESVTITVLLQTLAFDIVKVAAHTHTVGVGAEYSWLNRTYPGSDPLLQSLVEVDIKGKGKIHFDRIKIRLPNGLEKEVYFDISSFFGDGAAAQLDPRDHAMKKITELYS